MIWQDVILTAGTLVFIVALVPMVLASDKPPLSTSIPTGLTLLAFAPAQWTLGATYAACTGAVTGLLWLTLAAQKRHIAGINKLTPGGNGK